MSKTETAAAAILFLLLLLIPVLLTFQGLDFTDTGWLLTTYRNVFSHPESVSYWFHMWLTYTIGGAWNTLFGSLGLWGMKIAGVLIFWTTALLIFQFYRDLLRPIEILAGLFLGMIFNFANRISIIHYNNLTFLFFVLSVFLLVEGIVRKRYVLVFLAGIAVALNAFVRLPNILSWSIALLIPYSALLGKGFNKKHAMQLGVMACGLAAGIGLVLAAMAAAGQLHLYVTSLQELFAFSSDEVAHYGASGFERRFVSHNLSALLTGAAFILAAGGVARLIQVIRGKGLRIAAIIAAAALAILAGLRFGVSLTFIAVGFSYLTVLLILFTAPDREGRLKLSALGVLLTLVCMSTGSDLGIGVAEYALALSMPLLFVFWAGREDLSLLCTTAIGFGTTEIKLSMPRGVFKTVLVIFTAIVLFFGLPFLWHATYRDSGSRTAMIHEVDHPLLRRVRTTASRAAIVNELLHALKGRVRAGDPLLTFESACLVHYLAGTLPVTGNPWPIQFSPSEFRRKLERDVNNLGFLPVVVMARQELGNNGWPGPGELRGSALALENRGIMHEFLDTRGYSVVWENETFAIMRAVPAQGK